MSASKDPQIDRELYEQTLEEVGAGWLIGPVDRDTLTASLPCWVPSRRFAVVQGGKFIAVDDFSGSGVNGTVSACETVNPSDLDAIASHTRAVMDAFFGKWS